MERFLRAAGVAAALLLAGAGLPGCGNAPPPGGPGAAGGVRPVEVNEGNIIPGIKDGRLYLMVDLFPNAQRLEEASDQQRRELLLELSVQLAGAHFAKQEFRGQAEALVDYIYVTAFDECGDPDMSSVLRHGTVLLERKDRDRAAVKKDGIRFQAGKVKVRRQKAPQAPRKQ